MEASKFEVKVSRTEEAHIAYLSGELDLGASRELRGVLEPLAAQSTVPLKLNLRNLQYIDSTGIGVIVSVLKSRQAAGLAFAVQEVPPKIKRLLDLTGLTRFLVIEGGA